MPGRVALRQNVPGNATSTVAPRNHGWLPIFGAASGNPHGRAKECRCLGGPSGPRKLRGQIRGRIRIEDGADTSRVQKALTQRYSCMGLSSGRTGNSNSEGCVGLADTAVADALWAVGSGQC